MKFRPVFSALFDLAAGVVAIAIVLSSCLATHRIGDDFRAIVVLTGIAFFLAGLVRGPSIALPWQTLFLGAGGLLGIWVLVINNGWHLLLIYACLMACAFLASGIGVVVHRTWTAATRTRSLGIAATFLVLVSAFSWAAVPRIFSYAAFETRQSAAPSFAFLVNQKPVSSADLRGRVVVLDFWSTTCAACIQEMPHVAAVYQRFRNNPRVAFYAVDSPMSEGENEEKGRRTLARYHLEVPMAFDTGPARKALKIEGFPALLVIDAKGDLRFDHRGYDASEDLEGGLSNRIQSLLDSM